MNFITNFFKTLNLKVPAATIAGFVTPFIVDGLQAHGIHLDKTVITPIVIAVIGWLVPSSLPKGTTQNA